MRDVDWCKKNPNFNKKVEFEEILLYREPLMWPYIQINIRDGDGKTIMGKRKGCENMFTTISIIDYANDCDLLGEEEYIYAQL